MNKNKGAQMEAARQRKAQRGQTKAYLWSWRPGDRLRTPDGEFYMVVSADDDRTVVLQKLILDGRKQPIPGLRERALIRVVAGRDGVRLGGKWAQRASAEGAA
jgi:hypothetical protein